MLAGFIQLIHILVCVGLIVIVLLQADKGEGLAGAFGGGASSTVFGERGGGGFMSKLTTAMAVIFMVTSLIIAVYVPRWEEAAPKINYSQSSSSMPVTMPGMPPVSVPSAGTPAAAPAGEIPSGN
jgi:preprotein translocase subunit SecG